MSRPSAPTTPKPRRRWLQFSLRTLMVLMMVVGCGARWLAHEVERVRAQQRAAAAIEKLGGRVGHEGLRQLQLLDLSNTQFGGGIHAVGRGFVQYRLPESNREEWVLYSAFLNYLLPGGRRLGVGQTPAWCPTCGRFALAEDIPSIQSMEDEIRKIDGCDAKTVQTWAFVSNGRRIEELRMDFCLRIEWRRNRINPPRCLECGGFGTIAIQIHGEFLHPSTGEPVIEVGSGWADAGPWEAEFTPEGDRIAEPMKD